MLRKKWDAYAYTSIAFLHHIAFSVTVTIFGPALIDFKYLFNTSIDAIALYATFNHIGYMAGSLFGLLYKYLNRQITVIIVLTLTGVLIVLVPYCPNLLLFYICCALIGFGGGVWDHANNVWLTEIWQTRSAPLLQLSELFFGIGCILGPLLVKPFVIGEVETAKDNIIDLQLNSTTNILNVTDVSDERRQSLKTPFFINGAINWFGPILFAIMFFVKRYKIPEKIQNSEIKMEEFSSNKTSDTIGIKKLSKLEKTLVGLISLLFCLNICLEFSYLIFSATFNQYSVLKLHASDAASIMSAMTASFTLARALSFFIAFKLKAEYMLAYHYVIIFVALMLILFAQKSLIVVWIANIIMGYGMAILWASTFAFLKQYVYITNKIGSIMVFSGAFGILVTPFILGPYIKPYPMILIAYELILLTACVLLFSIINIIIRKFLIRE